MKPTLALSLLLSCAAACPVVVQAADGGEPPLSDLELAIIEQVNAREADMLAQLERLTNINSGSLNQSGLAQMADALSEPLVALGFSVQRLPGGRFELPHCPGQDTGMVLADHVLATREGSGPRLLLMGHMDTVFPPESGFQRFRRDGDYVYGPGVFDMKGGLVVMLQALAALHASDALAGRAITVLLNSDEEVGSLSSRPYLEAEAVKHDWGLVFEGSVNNTQIRTRKGLGQAHLVVHGRAAHAGSAHAEGRSAIRELAFKVLELDAMTDYETGLTVNVGLIQGGEARNMVAPCAQASVDIRYPLPEQGLAAETRIRQIADRNYAFPERSTEVDSELWISLHRPPKIPTAVSDALLQRTIAIGRLLGEDIGIADSGGGTDGSLTQAVGLPTLDALGVIGTGAHSEREMMRVDSLLQTTRRTAILIHRLQTPEGRD